jgi:hypothetical protein
MYKLCIRCGQEGHRSSSCTRPMFTRLIGTAEGRAQ